ncbi:hypothetical protein QBC47DRAFT_74262 [Echria macrotheca]|uniref:NF-kappa-B inhibitor-like protein 1 n=1 Tax=Echria macrotheca TaxID=438768 RepID=A0AAJ0B4W0_9PEZI|nr:hypothetical protein QBC47DRAFT_74262 [Echria macrotheca]
MHATPHTKGQPQQLSPTYRKIRQNSTSTFQHHCRDSSAINTNPTGMESPRSPKRRRILASINRPDVQTEDGTTKGRRDASPSPAPDSPETQKRTEPTPPNDAADGTGGRESSAAPKVKPFRFKSSKSHRSSRHRRPDEDDPSDSRPRHRRDRNSGSRSRSRSRSPMSTRHSQSHSSRRRHRRNHHHRDHDDRRHRRRKSPSAKADAEDEPDPPDPFAPAPLSPDTAFRESLFDAMADDEGAAYWESVYGQPIHVHQPPKGTLERMTDDEYAAYVRQKMWEKTHAGLVEERARREREKEEQRRRDEEGRRIAEEMERSLRRGEERRRRRGWKVAWEVYLGKWEGWDGRTVEGIPWPRRTEEEAMDEDGVRAFFVNGLALDELGEKEFAARLKDERVRWHPDKMQQRLGGTVEGGVMKDVTMIFQVIDRLWNDTRKAG